MSESQPTGHITCSQCGQDTPFTLEWRTGSCFVMRGAALPFSEAMKVELGRRKMGALCIPCWKGLPTKIQIMQVLPKERPKILTSENE